MFIVFWFSDMRFMCTVHFFPLERLVLNKCELEQRPNYVRTSTNISLNFNNFLTLLFS